MRHLLKTQKSVLKTTEILDEHNVLEQWNSSINVRYHIIIILLLAIKARLLNIYPSPSVSYYPLNLPKFENKEKLYAGDKDREEVNKIVQRKKCKNIVLQSRRPGFQTLLSHHWASMELPSLLSMELQLIQLKIEQDNCPCLFQFLILWFSTYGW